MDTNFKTKTAPAAGRRSLIRLADDKMREGQSATTMLGRVLRETGRKSIEVAAFGSSV
ncbi:hypothetical protein [Streptacidiphilus carbonis]|uniref:hypothetical protein n=1 Tax=Streptacidiphilus carbonis TaxID=105422 RepID=UPI000B31C6A9|nr:hypothetical protein [Streptacidiphilus carbonis]